MRLLASAAATAALAFPLALLAGPARAQYYGGYNASCSQVGSMTYCNGSDGTTLMQNNVGNSTYTNILTPYGNSNCITNTVGNSVYTNCF